MSVVPDLSAVLCPHALHPPCLAEGVIRTTPDDFEVDEIPAFAPSGEGSHLFLHIEKRDVSAGHLLQHLASTLQVSQRDIGTAGQKDRHAVTRQFVSVPASCESRLPGAETDAIRILSVVPHRQKLRTGLLKGNRFQLVLRHAETPFSDADLNLVQQRLRELESAGCPNYFGPQRFGHGGSTFFQGLAILNPNAGQQVAPARQPWLRRLALSAAQSAVFNGVAGARVRAGTAGEPQAGDVVIRRGGSKPFLYQPAEPGAADNGFAPRTTDPLLPAGPMPGPEMLPAAGAVHEQECRVMEELDLSLTAFAAHAKLCRGTRRCMLEFPESTDAELTEDGALVLQFTLTAGAFATVLLREIVGNVTDATTRINPE